MFAAVPLLVLPVAIYNLVLLTMSGGVGAETASAELGAPLFAAPMPSDGAWPVSLGDLLLTGALVILFVELLRSPGDRRAVIVNRSLSAVLFVGCFVEFLLLKGFATSVFFLITLMALLDVLAGLAGAFASAGRKAEG